MNKLEDSVNRGEESLANVFVKLWLWMIQLVSEVSTV